MKKKVVFLAGHRGMVGSSIYRILSSDDSTQLIVRDRDDLDLTDFDAVMAFFKSHLIDEVYLAAAKVGGIHANSTYPADFIITNLRIQINVIHAAHATSVDRLLFLGSSCIYPKHASQPITEGQLLTGELEASNEPYAIAKIAGIKMCEALNRQYGTDFRSVMPTNLYGPGDNFHPENSHVVPALIRRFHEAVQRNDDNLAIWGTGSPKREFLHVDDMAAACVHVMGVDKKDYYSAATETCSHINIGTGQDCTIRELAETISIITGFRGKLDFDTSRADGTPRKLLDVSRINKLGWKHSIALVEGLRTTYNWYQRNEHSIRAS